MPTNRSLDERKAALREYMESAEDPITARAFIVECLDAVTDADLLLWLEESFPETSTPQTA